MAPPHHCLTELAANPNVLLKDAHVLLGAREGGSLSQLDNPP
jgi:hypothetical protein